MNGFPTKSQLYAYRASYPVGCRIELIEMDDPYSKLKPGDRGTVRGVDDAGQVMMQWDSGSSLSLIPGVDRFKRLD